MNQRAAQSTPRPARRRTAWIVGGVVLALLLSAALWEGKPWQSSSTSLVGTSWTIDRVQGAPMQGGAFRPYLQFLPHATIFGIDKFLGEDSCNSLQGTYEITGDHVRFTDIGSSLVGCPQGAPDVIGALGATHSWNKSGNKLVLYDATGAPTIELTWTSRGGYSTDEPAPTPT